MQTQKPVRELLLTNAEMAHDRAAHARFDRDEWKHDMNVLSQREFERKYASR